MSTLLNQKVSVNSQFKAHLLIHTFVKMKGNGPFQLIYRLSTQVSHNVDHDYVKFQQTIYQRNIGNIHWKILFLNGHLILSMKH